MTRFEPSAARHAFDDRIAPLVPWAARRGGINGAAGLGDEAFHARAAAEIGAALAPLFAALHARRDLAELRRTDALRRLDACRAAATAGGWLGAMRRLARGWTAWRAAARVQRESERLAEAEALLRLEAMWRSDATARLVAAYQDEAVRGRAASGAIPEGACD